jgi:hypothetical protein
VNLSTSFSRIKSWLLRGLIALAIFTLFTAHPTYVGYNQIYNLGGDQQNEGIIILKRTQPDLFSRDYTFSDPSFFDFYTPLYLDLVQQIMNVTGDYALALLALLPAIMIAYLIGMFLLLFSITRSTWIAISIALVSSLVWPVFAHGEVWGVANLRMVMPRAFFCALTPWLLLLIVHWLPSTRWWEWPLIALTSGLGANLHPVSGLSFIEVLMTSFVLMRGISMKNLGILIIMAGGATVGAWPILTNFVKSTSTGIPSVPFERFAQVMRARFGTLFFSPLPRVKFLGFVIGIHEREILLWIYLAGMAIWAIAFVLVKFKRVHSISERGLYAVLLVLQLPIAYLLTWLQATALILFIVCYWAIRNLQSEPDLLDRWLLVLMAAVVCFSFVASFVLEALWVRFELWPLTSLMAEQLRTGRFIYPLLFILAARFMQITIERLPIGRGFLLAASAVGVMAFAPSSLLWSLLAGLTIWAWCYGREWINAHKWVEMLLDAATWALVLRVVFLIIETPTSRGGLLVLCLTGGYVLFTLCWRYLGHGGRIAFGIGVALLLTYSIVSGSYAYSLPISSWVADFASAPSRLWARVYPVGLSQISEEHQDELELYDWAREHTDEDSLFYYDSFQRFDALAFRFQAQRSVTHCWKDLGLAYYTKVRLVEFYDRYQKLQGAYEDPARLLAYAFEEQADYIVIASSRGVQLNLPVAFENSRYVVYQLEQGAQ